MIYGFCVCAPVQTFFPVPFHPFFPASLPLSFSRYCHVLKSCWLHVPAYSFGRFHSPRAGLYSLCIKPVCVFHRLWLSYVVLHFQLAAKHFRALVTGFPISPASKVVWVFALKPLYVLPRLHPVQSFPSTVCFLQLFSLFLTDGGVILRWFRLFYLVLRKYCCSFKPLHPNIRMHILHTVLYTFLKVLMRRICLTVMSALVVDHVPYSHDLCVWFRADILRRN